MQIITQINTKIFTWKTRYGKNHGTVVHLKTSTINNNGFTTVLPQIQLRDTTYTSSRITYSRITTRYKRIIGEKLTILTAPFSVKTASFHATNLRSNRPEWRATRLEAAVKISARSNGERARNRRKSTDCSAASSSLFFSVFFSSLLFFTFNSVVNSEHYVFLISRDSYAAISSQLMWWSHHHMVRDHTQHNWPKKIRA